MLRALGPRYRELRNTHRDLIRAEVHRVGGVEVDAVGDAYFAAFRSPADGILAAVSAQSALALHAWGTLPRPAVRMGLHSGHAEVDESAYVGLDVHLAARIAASGHGGQIVVSDAAIRGAAGSLPAGVTVRDLGAHRLKDIPGTVVLYDLAIPGMKAHFPSLRTLGAQRTLPAEVTSFVGRSAEVSQLRSLMNQARLVTLIGAGGSGKTRLALRAAHELATGFADGAAFISAADARNVDEMISAANDALGVEGQRGVPGLETLMRELREQEALLVWDNLEQVADAGPTIAQLLTECRRLRVLATSRIALNVRAEKRFPVPPLTLPAEQPQRLDFDAVERSEAVALFAERARDVDSSFELTTENAAAVALVCRRLDGLPLAIELASARLAMLAPHELAERLGSGLELLDDGPRDLPSRQRALRSCIRWSYDLLSLPEQLLFEALSAVATADLAAIEEMMGGLTPFRSMDVLTLTASLLDKSLLYRVEDRLAGGRLAMLETIRAFAVERLSARPDFEEDVRRAHAEYFAAAADRLTAIGHLGADAENLRTAWHYALSHKRMPLLDRLAPALSAYYEAEGRYAAKVEMLTEHLEALESIDEIDDRATRQLLVMTQLGRSLLALEGYTDEVQATYERALNLIGASDPARALPVLGTLALVHTYSGDYARAAMAAEEILNLARARGNPTAERDGHLLLGMAIGTTGDVRRGLEHVELAATLSAHPDVRSDRGEGYDRLVSSLTTSAFYLWLLGYLDRAADRGARAIEAAMELRHPLSVAYANFHCGLLFYWLRDLPAAAHHANEVIATAEHHDFEVWRAVGHVLRGAARAGAEDATEGLAELESGIMRYRTARAPITFWPLLQSLRSVALALAGRAEEGVAAIDEAISICEAAATRGSLAELHVIKGRILAGMRSSEAEAVLRRAHQLAEEGQQRTPRLRAAITLCQLAGNSSTAIRRLDAAHSAMTEGFGMPDMVEAAEVLRAHGTRHRPA